MKPLGLHTVLATVALAALFSTVATQIYALIVPTRSALWLLILFFTVGLGVAWIALRADARHARETPSESGNATEPPAAQDSPAAPDSSGTP